LTNAQNLQPFVNLIKNFTLPQHLFALAKKFKFPEPNVVQDVEQMLQTIMIANWRENPMLLDIPANGQIFGQIVSEAGIDGILYSSTKNIAKKCLAIFPTSVANTLTYIELEGQIPAKVMAKRLDSTSWKLTT
jgi:hypothetical protein